MKPIGKTKPNGKVFLLINPKVKVVCKICFLSVL